MELMRSVIRSLREIVKLRHIIFELTKKDIQLRYLGSYLGILWAFVQPTINILILWFVFQVGFKSMPVDNFPFILWLMAGMVPWMFFSDSVTNATTSIIENGYLVKKVVFKVSILPLIKILSSLFIHVFFILLLFIMFWVYGFGFQIYYLQVFYYLIASVLLVLGISWITSALIVFLKDIGQIVGMLLQFLFWLTPIFWSFKILPPNYHFVVKLNPLYYIVEGYRNAFIYHKWFWEEPKLTFYFWILTFLVIIIGGSLFKKLRPHFSDVI
ncbi:transport permease protein [Collibacillus ludicampi]|uniref:Transport permease protein n=1 Tax=Collibacillus ludicampi TaxID=2771369 RepID=A0AAV4LCU8_9BACL|nr:ABC transporter permease [Collibacillus ludicampi]GIM45667.1 transport permease protein [Collibacillus ludicampi]